MNQSDLSEAFGLQIGALTIGTRYEINSESEETMDNTEVRIRMIMYNLWMDAQSKKLADSLKRKQAEHFEQLYEFSYGVSMYDTEQYTPRDAGSLALRIIDEKQAFIKRNERLILRHERFIKITNSLDYSSKRILVDYFEFRKKIDYELLRNTLTKHLKTIERIYKVDEDSKESDADNREDELQDKLGRKRYLINRRNVYMTPEEYVVHSEKEKAERIKFYEQVGLSMP
ncbi:hypothetical protein [Paenisporosarcina sp. OV554]|uniref:hypothetical protein n=1 Tax=Paenisporosarcina sp. OV554 TaxID=2135694 RepID=UPI000D3D4D2B|nr:hypothetical protein [Paenisporosarcina sp. OV554]PUB12220.1 hypothetical protein C8K15_11025 [Paenisporosarcina sp. OV554]